MISPPFLAQKNSHKKTRTLFATGAINNRGPDVKQGETTRRLELSMDDDQQESESGMTDHQLMISVRDQRCVRSFELLVDRWREPIARLCNRMVFSWDDAEDMTQEVFSRLFQSRERYRATAKFSTFLWQIAINRCRDFLRSTERRKQKQAQLIETKIGELNSAHRADDTTDRVRDALAELNPIYREVLVLRHYENLKFNQIATVLEIPFGTVASRMSKALKLLGEQLVSNTKTI